MDVHKFLFKGVMIMSNFNIGSFFSSGSTNSSSNYLADYASIKSGSYRRLMKSYYNSSDSYSSKGSTARTNNVLEKLLEERRNPTISKEAQEANQNLTTGLSNLTKSVAALQNDSTFTDSQNGQTAGDKVLSAVKAYVSDYNDVVSSSKKSTLTNKSSHVGAMMSSSNENADKLKEIGITINRDGTLLLNEKALQAADISKVQDLFSTKDVTSYGSVVKSRVQMANSAAGVAAADKTTDKDKTDTATGSSASALKSAATELASSELYAKVKDKNGKETYDIDKILSTAQSFVKNYNSMFDAAKTSTNSGVSSNLAQIKDKTTQNAFLLKNFGITVDVNGKMAIDSDTFKKSDMSQVQNFFKNYGSSIATNASLVDYYMTTQANAGSGYTANGAYNVQGSSRYADSI